jgi:hypothetical protein
MYPIENDTVQPRRSQRCTAVPSSKVRDDARESTEPNHAKQEATNSNGKFPDDVNRRDKCSCGKDIETSEYTSRNMQRVGVSCFL